MKRLNARLLLQYSTEELWNLLIGDFKLVFDDGGEIETNYRETCFSSYAWDFFRLYPNTPMTKDFHLQSVLRGKALDSKSHVELINRIFWKVVETYRLNTPALKDPGVKLMFKIRNDLYVGVSKQAEAFVVSVDILDFIDIIDDPVISETLNHLTYEDESIQAAYGTIMDHMSKAPSLDENAMARAVRANTVNRNQTLQCVGPRGFPTDVDGSIMPIPILRSYTKGMGSFYNTLAESRSAAKSLYFAESPLQDAEYFARRLQLLCMVVERVHFKDCGSTEYLLWRVKPPVEQGGTAVYAGDLKFLAGKFYLDEATGTLKAIKTSDTHLYNQVLKLRSAIHCKDADPHAVCHICFGELSENLTPETCLGHACAATMTQQTSQSVLSNKHLDASSKSEPIILTEVTRKYFYTNKQRSAYLLKKELKGTPFRIIVSQDEAFGLTDAMSADNLENISPSHVSEIDFIGIETREGMSVEAFEIPPNVTPVCISQNGRMALMTQDFLRYLKTHRGDLDTKGNYVFDLTYWDYDKPIFELPAMEYSYSQHSHQIANLIESRMKDITDRQKPDSPSTTLVELFDLVNTKLNVNLALLEVIIYATMVRDINNDDFGMARGSESKMLGVAEQTIKNRSLSSAYAYEEQVGVITNPMSFFKLSRPDSIFDAFLAPREVIQHHPRKYNQ